MHKIFVALFFIALYFNIYSQNRYTTYIPSEYAHPSQHSYNQSDNASNYSQEKYDAALKFAMFLLNKIADIRKERIDEILFNEIKGYESFLLQAIPKQDLDGYFNELMALSDKISQSAGAYSLRKANESKGNESVILPHDSTEFYLRMGVSEYKAQKYFEAIQNFSRGLIFSPNSIPLMLNRAYAKLQLDDWVGVYNDAVKVIKVDSTIAEAYYLRANYFSMNEKYSESILDFNKAIDLSPNQANYYYFRGGTFLLMKKLENACNDFSRAGELGSEKAYERIKMYCNPVKK